jgi:hypothetical protein
VITADSPPRAQEMNLFPFLIANDCCKAGRSDQKQLFQPDKAKDLSSLARTLQFRKTGDAAPQRRVAFTELGKRLR